MKNPFSQDDYNSIFRVSKKNQDLIDSRESSTLEFKESFNIKVLLRCMKTIAGFANNEGGYIVFGIKDQPHILQGLDHKNEEKFDNFDPARLTTLINNHFLPSICVELQKYKFKSKVFGIMYVHEAISKPVICTKTEDNNLRESAIYFRYRGQTREIRYSELRQMIDKIVEKNNEMWQTTFRKIGKIGVDNLALIDTIAGDLSIGGRRYLVDDELLSKLNYVEEGRFVEKDGEPTLKLVGKLETIDGNTPVISNTKIITKLGIRSENIVHDFLKQVAIENPLDYIVQICFESSSYLPVYYYIHKCGLSVNEIINRLSEVKSRQQTKKRLVDRLTNHSTLFMKFKVVDTPAYQNKQIIRSAIVNGSYKKSDNPKDIRYFCQMVRNLTKEELVSAKKIVSDNLWAYYQDYYLDREFMYMDDIRKAICYLDYELFSGGKVESDQL